MKLFLQNPRTLKAPPPNTSKHPAITDFWLRAWLLLLVGDKLKNEWKLQKIDFIAQQKKSWQNGKKLTFYWPIKLRIWNWLFLFRVVLAKNYITPTYLQKTDVIEKTFPTNQSKPHLKSQKWKLRTTEVELLLFYRSLRRSWLLVPRLLSWTK